MDIKQIAADITDTQFAELVARFQARQVLDSMGIEPTDTDDIIAQSADIRDTIDWTLDHAMPSNPDIHEAITKVMNELTTKK